MHRRGVIGVVGVHGRRAVVRRAVRVRRRSALLGRRRRHFIVGIHHNHVFLVGAHVRRHITTTRLFREGRGDCGCCCGDRLGDGNGDGLCFGGCGCCRVGNRWDRDRDREWDSNRCGFCAGHDERGEWRVM